MEINAAIRNMERIADGWRDVFERATPYWRRWIISENHAEALIINKMFDESIRGAA